MANRNTLLAHILLRGLFLCLLAGGGAWMLHRLQDQPNYYQPTAIEIPLSQGQEITLGRAELAAREAEVRHILVEHRQDGSWWLRNVAERHAVDVTLNGRSKVMREGPLESSVEAIRLSTHQLQTRVLDGILHLETAPGHTATYEGTRLLLDGSHLPACPDADTEDRILAHWNAWMPRFLRTKLVIKLGGNINCDNHLAVPGLPRNAAYISYDGQFHLRAGSISAGAISIQSGTSAQILADLPEPISQISTIVLGRTVFSVKSEPDRLILQPTARAQLFAGAPPQSPPGVIWTSKAYSAWQQAIPTPWLIAGLLIPIALAILAFRLDLRMRPAHMLGISIAGSLCFTAVFSGLFPVGVAWQALLAISGLLLLSTFNPCQNTHALLAQGLLSILLAVGLLTLFEMGLVVAETEGFRYFSPQADKIALGAGLVFMVSILPACRKCVSIQRSTPVVIVLGATAIALLGAQALWGDETGLNLWGTAWQPVELGKTALLCVTGYVLATRLGYIKTQAALASKHGRLGQWLVYYVWQWFVYFLPAALLFLWLGITLIFVHDWSPCLLAAGLITGLSLAWSMASGEHKGWVFAVVIVAVAISAYCWIRFGDGLTTLRSLGFYAQRFATMLHPDLYPHTGYQIIQATNLIEHAGLLGQETANPWRVPAVQFDMTTAYYIGRFGAVGAALLVMLQGGLLVALLVCATTLLHHIEDDYFSHGRRALLFFLIFGFAALLTTHFTLAWMMTYGQFPVIGQPMVALSSTGSLLLLMIVPLQFCLQQAGQELVGEPT